MYNAVKMSEEKKTWLRVDRLVDLRKGKGYDTQESFAEALGVKQQYVSKWETGFNDPGAESLVKLSKFFNVSIDYLLDQSPDPHLRSELVRDPDLPDLLAAYLTPDNAPEILKRVAAFLESED